MLPLCPTPSLTLCDWTSPSSARVRVRYHPTHPILRYPVQVGRFHAYRAALASPMMPFVLMSRSLEVCSEVILLRSSRLAFDP